MNFSLILFVATIYSFPVPTIDMLHGLVPSIEMEIITKLKAKIPPPPISVLKASSIGKAKGGSGSTRVAFGEDVVKEFYKHHPVSPSVTHKIGAFFGLI